MIGNESILVSYFLHPVGSVPISAFDIAPVGYQRCKIVRRQTVLHSFLVHNHGILFRVKQVGHTIYILHAHVAVVADLRLSSLTLPGSNKDNAVGSTRPVDSGRSGILQYVNALYVSRVQPIDISSCHTINNIKRC